MIKLKKINKFRYDYFLIIFFSLIVIITSGRGADFGEYSKWTEYFSSFNFEILSEYPKSIKGTPLVQWQYGVGVLAGVLHKLFGVGYILDNLFDPQHHGSVRASIIASIICVVNFLLLIFILKKHIKNNFYLLVIFFSFFLFTPAGYYFNKFSTESWSIFLILLSLTISEINKKNFRKFIYVTPIIISIINYFLILIKATNILICLSLVVIFATTIPKEKFIFSNNYKYIFKTLFILAVIPFIAVIMMSIYHFTINGSIFSSPYNISDYPFASLDFKNLKTVEILFSPLHGMVYYHPILLFSFFYLLKKILFCEVFLDTKNLICLSVIFAFLFQLFIQSAFFIWWEGTGTYGSRTFSGVSILIFYTLLRFKDNINFLKLNNFYIFLIFLFVIYQSYILGLGETNFKSLISFFINEQDLFDRPKFQKNNEILFFSIIAILSFSFFFKKFFRLKKLFFLSWFLILVTFVSYIALILFQYNNRPYLLPIILLLSFITTKYHREIFSISISFYKRLSHLTALYGFLIVFITSIFFQFTLFTQLKEVTNNNYTGGKSFSCNDWRASYYEYLQIPGYNYEKSVLLNFLEKNKCLFNK
jgi:hypothetical protein